MFNPIPIKGAKIPKVKKIEPPLIAIDLDGVLHDKAHPLEGKRMGLPIEGAKEALEQLQNRYTLIIHTVMATTPGGTQVVEDWLKYYQIPYSEVTAVKPNALYFVDDHALHFTNWNQTLQEIK